MATGFASLRDQTVGAPGHRRARLCFGTDHHEDEDSGIAEVLDRPVLVAERQHDRVYSGVDAHLDVSATNEGKQQVYRDGTTLGLGTHLVDRGSQLPRRGQPECAQAARLRDGRRQRCPRQSATHSGLTHWNIEPQSVCDVHAVRRYAVGRRRRIGRAGFRCWRAAIERNLGLDGWVKQEA